MQKERLDYLLNQHFNDVLSSQETEELNNWFYHLNLNGDDYNNWLKETGGDEKLAELLYKNYKTKNLPQKETRIFPIKKWLPLAAAVLVFLGVGFWFFRMQNEPVESVNNNSPKKEIVQIKPGDNKATLTLENGEVIVLEDLAVGKTLNKKGFKVTKTADGQLNYVIDDQATAEINTISTPKGGQYKVVLSDGTQVWLNAASQLKFPSKFTGKTRTVDLEGEAYFEVAHQAKQPFIVNHTKQKITVLGTHFNVKAYSDEKTVTTTLLEGSVKINSNQNNFSNVLNPGQKSILQNNNITISKADVEEAVAWKNGYFKFKDEDIYTIMNQIARWYDVDLVYREQFENKRFSAYISRKKNINEILHLMEATKGINFRIEGRIVTVMK